MILSQSTIPIVLLFVYSVISIDVYKNKRETQERLDVDRTIYDVNHPPLEVDTTPDIFEDKKEKEGSSTKSTLDDSDNTEESKIITADSHDVVPTKARTLNIGSHFTVANLDLLETPKENKGNNRKRGQRRRLQQVKKTSINKNESKSETSESPIAVTVGKVNTYTTQQTFTQAPVNRLQSTTARIRKETRTRAPVVPIVESENYVYSHRGNFHYSYEGGDGTRAFEKGQLRTSEYGEGMGEAVEGSFSYTDKDGNDFSLTYTADENGYRPVGAHLPTPPPIPPEIQAALRLLATKTTPEPVTEKVKNYN